jgi:hypothetical protein
MLVTKSLELFVPSGVVRIIVLIGSHLNSSYHLNAFHSSVPGFQKAKRQANCSSNGNARFPCTIVAPMSVLGYSPVRVQGLAAKSARICSTARNLPYTEVVLNSTAIRRYTVTSADGDNRYAHGVFH